MAAVASIVRHEYGLPWRPCMERSAWTDERLDERMTAIDQRFDRGDEALGEIREELRGLRGDFGEEMRAMRSDLSRFEGRMTLVGFMLVGVLIAAVVALFVG